MFFNIFKRKNKDNFSECKLMVIEYIDDLLKEISGLSDEELSTEQTGISKKIYSTYLLADKFYEVNREKLMDLNVNVDNSNKQLDRCLESSVKIGLEVDNKFKNTIEAFTYIKEELVSL